MGEHSETPDAVKSAPRFRVLLIGHDPKLSAEATIVLAAVAARNGLLGDGRPSGGRVADGATPPAAGAATIAEVARETGLHRGAVRRGVAELLRCGQLLDSDGGLQASPEALANRWADHRRRIRLDERLRSLGLRADPLLLSAMVAGQVDESGRWVCGMPRLIERTGMPRRCLFRHLHAAEEARAIHRWIAPIGRGQMILAPGVSRTGTREATRSGTREGAEKLPPSADGGQAHQQCHEAAPVDVAKRHSDCREAALPMSQSGTRHPDLRSTGSPPEEPAPAKPAGEPVAALPVPKPAPASPASLGERRDGGDDVQAAVEAWLLPFRTRGIERMRPQDDAAVAKLLELVGSAEQVLNPRAVARERLRLAARVIAWCPSPERLCRWLVRARRRFGVSNLGAYLRSACQRGDPGTLLSASPAATSRGGRDFSPATERALEGEHVVEVAQLVEVGSTILAGQHDDQRAKLRAELRRYLGENRRAAARTVLLQLIGGRRDDLAIARAIGDVCAVSDARALLQEVA